jgi:hypothetical protein
MFPPLKLNPPYGGFSFLWYYLSLPPFYFIQLPLNPVREGALHAPANLAPTINALAGSANVIGKILDRPLHGPKILA